MEDNVPQKATCNGNRGVSSMDIHLILVPAIFCQILCPMLYTSYLKTDIADFKVIMSFRDEKTETQRSQESFLEGSFFLRADHLFNCLYLNMQNKSVALNFIMTRTKIWLW